MYTNCTQVCPTTTTNMVSIQEEIKDLGLDIEIVAFSVDPEYDTHEVLRAYAEDSRVDLNNWTFLTGYKFAVIKSLSEKSFKAQLAEGSPGDVQYAHTTSFFLVNPAGELVKRYDGMGMGEMKVIIEYMKKVL